MRLGSRFCHLGPGCLRIFFLSPRSDRNPNEFFLGFVLLLLLCQVTAHPVLVKPVRFFELERGHCRKPPRHPSFQAKRACVRISFLQTCAFVNTAVVFCSSLKVWTVSGLFGLSPRPVSAPLRPLSPGPLLVLLGRSAPLAWGAWGPLWFWFR